MSQYMLVQMSQSNALQINYLLFNLQQMSGFQRHLDDFRTTIMSIQKKQEEKTKIKFITAEKWKTHMLKSLTEVAQLKFADVDLIHDLNYVIKNITEDKFIQAILNVQPFKPMFKQTPFLTVSNSFQSVQFEHQQSTITSQKNRTKLIKDQSIIEIGSIIRQKKNNKKNNTLTKSVTTSQNSNLKQYIKLAMQQQTLTKQFQKKYHPFKKVLQSFIFIFQNKYKNIIDQNSKKLRLEWIQRCMTNDILVLQHLFSLISEPYQNIFQSQNAEQNIIFKNKMNAFMREYIHNHEKISLAIRKIMRHYSRKTKSIILLQQHIPDFATIDKFNIPQDFKIDGCYIQSMNGLMQFAQQTKPTQALKRLKQFRYLIAKDVDYFYQATEQIKERQISAQIQIQIIRFIICKLKGWVPQIYAQLKFLQIVYGDEQIAYKYDEASYIYAQLITAFDSLEVDCSEESERLSMRESSLKQSLLAQGS